MIRRWSKVYSLVSPRDVKTALNRHVEDSLSLLEVLPEEEPHLDIGSGAGFPGIPMAIYRPQQQFILNDRSKKKCRFLREIKSRLKLANIEISEHDRQHPLPTEDRFKSITIRSVAPPPQAWLLARTHLKQDGLVFLQTSEKLLESDLADARVHNRYRTNRGWITTVGLRATT